MDLSFTEREREGIPIIDVKGQVVAGDGADQLRECVKAIAEAGRTNAILNLAAVSYIDSSGLGALVMSFSTLRKAGGALKLLNLTRRNVELLVLTKLETVFEVYDDEQNAVNSFFPGREIKKFDILMFLQQSKRQP
ncbi:MAG: STAS domain-containing protein [Acidobacteria bacterium]|nr:STAS domain-containing protein [Acidobacteriota bacterium]MBM3769577.1 STAS domain-containing protein [Acidobacteriota bacterium]